MSAGGALVLVTGAGGFIGGAVARRLAAQPGVSVRGGTRDGRALGAGIAPWRLDVCDRGSLDAALVGVDAVVHCAYGDRTTTVEGTRLLLEAARQARVRRVVHLSSIAVYGPAAGVVPETTALLPAEGRGYAHWKVATEAACWAAEGLEVVILRPAIVYGRGSAQWVEQPVTRLRTRRWGDLGRMGLGTANLVHVQDVAAACVAALDAPGVAGAAFNISGDETVTWREWYARLATAVGVAPLRVVSPGGWWWRVAFGLPLRVLAKKLPGAASMLRGRALLAPSPHEMRLFALAATYPTGKAAALLGWRPCVGLEAGLAESVGGAGA